MFFICLLFNNAWNPLPHGGSALRPRLVIPDLAVSLTQGSLGGAHIGTHPQYIHSPISDFSICADEASTIHLFLAGTRFIVPCVSYSQVSGNFHWAFRSDQATTTISLPSTC